MNDYVRERLSRLLSENLPRRAHPQPTPTTTAPRQASRPPSTTGAAAPQRAALPEGPPELLPTDDDDPLAWVRRPAVDPPRPRTADHASLGDGEPDRRELDLIDDEADPPPRRFTRAHLGVVAVLLVIGLLIVGWSALRARPVAIASTPALSGASSGATPAPGGTVAPASLTPATPFASGGATQRPSATPGAAGSSQILVHVLGAVQHPGVVKLGERARVQDALAAAGGLRHNVAPADLNLAQVLTDGQQVVIGTTSHPLGEVRETSAGGDSMQPGSTQSGSHPSGAAQAVNLNSATELQLEELPGVGPVTAAKIVAWREEHTRFSRVEELQEVDGIGPKTYAQIAPHARV